MSDACASNVWLSLNLEFNTLDDFNSGGTWTVVAKTDEQGLAGINLVLENINFDASTGFLAPVIFYSFDDVSPFPNPNLMQINGAGFTQLGNLESAPNIEILEGEIPFSPQGIFYHVGLIGGATQPGENGTPNVAAGIDSRQVPWGGYTDSVVLANFGSNPNLGSFTGGVELATGTFDAGVVPDWFTTPQTSQDDVTEANVFTTIGTSSSAGSIVSATVFATVRYTTSVPEPSTLVLLSLLVPLGAAILRQRYTI